jgi:hypothetical protein
MRTASEGALVACGCGGSTQERRAAREAAGTGAGRHGVRGRLAAEQRGRQREQVWAVCGARRCRQRKRAHAGAGPERRRTARSEQWRARRIQTREQQRDAGQGRARFGRARMEVRRGGSGQTRTEGNVAAHDSTLARTVAEGPATRQGRGERESGSRKGCVGRQRAGQWRARQQHSSASTGRAQAATELVYRKVARSAGGAAVQ